MCVCILRSTKINLKCAIYDQNRDIQTILHFRITSCIFSNTSKHYMSDCKAMQFFCRLLSPDPSYLHANITGKVFM